MHIISKFHDYYDSAMGLGVDRSLVYMRVDEPGNTLLAPRWHYDVKEETHRVGLNPSDTVSIRSAVYPIIFCGKLYLRAIAHVTYRNPKREAYPSHVVDVYTADSRRAVLARVYTEHRLSPKDEKYKTWRDSNVVSFREWAEKRDWVPDHIREQAPVLLIRQLTWEERHLEMRNGTNWNEITYRIQKNPHLKAHGFYQVKDAFTTFQELSMFLGGVMGTSGRPMVKLNDKEVHAKHGFDKWSFRKMPES